VGKPLRNLKALSEGVHSITAKATDAADNTSAASSALSVRIDTVAPQVVPGDVNNPTWRNSSLSQAFTASDPGPASGLANAADGSFTLTASAESTKDAAGNVVPTSVTKTVSDVANNTHAGINSAAFKIDLSDPQLGITDNNVATYNVCGSARPSRPSFNPSDAISGLDLT
jgi:hypothetical protein